MTALRRTWPTPRLDPAIAAALRKGKVRKKEDWEREMGKLVREWEGGEREEAMRCVRLLVLWDDLVKR